ncbi:hypothetical protein GOV06_02730 [Candidatus Woesearchaeota archaeon]|nr:hypothetical protein [Candidatus Woesearchaeota archaeon]
MKIKVDGLNWEQMDQVRFYLTQHPNRLHSGRRLESYGNYVEVKAEDCGNYFQNVTFKFNNPNPKNRFGYEQRLRERDEVVGGLAILLADMTEGE